jgi:hypothetical protein
MAKERSVIGATLSGTWRFALVSILGFAPWALPNIGGEIFLYIECLLAFLVFSEVFLVALVQGENRRKRFNRSFGPAFIAYAVVWSACWFALRSRAGEVAGLILGCSVFAWILGKRLGSLNGLPLVILVLVLFHAIGYWMGGYVFSLARKPPGIIADWPKRDIWMLAKITWGLFYGLGFGSGIGYAFFKFQQKTDAPS